MSSPTVHFEPLLLAIARETSYARRLDEQAKQAACQFAPDAMTNLSVLVTCDNAITGLWTDRGQAQLHEFVDDTGQDLRPGFRGLLSQGISPDSGAALFEVSGQAAPHPTANEVLLRGRIRVSTARDVSAEKSSVVRLESGTTVSVAGFDFDISAVKPSGYGDGELEVVFLRAVTQSQIRDVARICFEDAEGNRLDFRTIHQSAHGRNDNYELEDNYLFREAVSELSIVVESWSGRVEDDYEFHVQSGIGCAPRQAQ